MSDVFVFLMGVIVMLFVTGAVGLLLWGAASEPAQGETIEEHAYSQPDPAPARVLVDGDRARADDAA